MAEIIASDLLKVVFEKLASEAVKKIVRSQGIQSEFKNLERTLSQIQALLNDASQKEITDEAVKQWLNSLQHLAYDIDDILDDLTTEAMYREFNEESASITSKVRKLVPSCCINFSLSNRMHHKLDTITTKLQDLEKEKNTLGLIVKDGRSKNINRKLQTSLVDASSIIGRKGEKEELISKLLVTGDDPCNQNFSIVPIVGMGGVGKTTLARILYDEKRVNDHFELKAWVCVSDDFDSYKISKVIFQYVTGESKEFEDFNLLQVALRDQVMGKRFLLVLDDVWSESYEDWETLMRPFRASAPGSKIIMTTRKEQLLKKLGYVNLNQLQSLSQDDAMSLLAQHALGVNNFDSHPSLKPHGEGIVEKCDGLPLALIVLGRLLRTKAEEEEYWKGVLNSEIWRLQDGDGIVAALRLSYYDLSAHLKKLFAYCSLFPKDYLFDKEELVQLWMAEGFLHQPNPSQLKEECSGLEYFEELLSRSFFQRSPNEESLFVMHDLMNDLATSVSGEFFVRLDNNEMEKDIRKETLEKYRHMSFVCEEYEPYKKFEVFSRAKGLRTFLATSVRVVESGQTFYLSNKVLVDLLPRLPLLRVLCLRFYNIHEVPESIGNLKHLRYLSLSQTQITHLPESVCNLFNLQTLILFRCYDLIALPNRLLQLKNLKYFDIRDTPRLKKMPSLMGELKNLKTLSKIIIGDENKFEIAELKNFKNLRGKISILGLEKVQNAIHAFEANFSQMRLTELDLEWSDVFNVSRNKVLEREVLNELKPHNDNLKQLKIVSYGGTELPTWVGDPSFLRLKHVSLCGCKNCVSLPPLGDLPSLKELFISGLDGVKVVGLELLGTRLAFPSLETLEFADMPGWETWSMNSRVAFPCLQEFHIVNCPNLVEVSLEAIPSLRVLKIFGCCESVLRSLVQVASSVIKWEIGYISGLTYEVWRGIIKFIGSVEELVIYGFSEIRHLWESEIEASKALVSLRSLEVRHCANLVSFEERREDVDGNYWGNGLLTSITIVCCYNMEYFSCPDSLEKLYLSSCTSVKAISFPARGLQKLKSLSIYDCNILLDKNFVEQKFIKGSNMPMLEDIFIHGWQDLQSVTEMNYLVHLVKLQIQNCENLESISDMHLSHLTSLKHVIIENCPSMDPSFPSGVWPPKLCSLRIGMLKKPVSEWGRQNFPTSLVDLFLFDESTTNDMSSCSQLSHLFPSSLTSLTISGFMKLESLSTGFQHLTSLQHLAIFDCPMMMHLPETLLPSLLSLKIKWCPKMYERTNGKGSYYWPLISHIPRIDIFE